MSPLGLYQPSHLFIGRKQQVENTPRIRHTREKEIETDRERERARAGMFLFNFNTSPCSVRARNKVSRYKEQGQPGWLHDADLSNVINTNLL